MWFSDDELDGLREFAEMQRELEETMTNLQIHFNSELTETARVLNEFAEQEQDLTRFVQGVRMEHTQAAAALANSFPIEEYQATARVLQEPLIPLEAIQAISEAVEPISRITVDLANNQVFLDALEESITMRTTLDELALISASKTYARDEIYEPEVDDVETPEIKPSGPTVAIYNQTVDPYGPVREELNEIQILIANYILASAFDSGELSSDLSEEQKKAVRLGLALSVGLLIGTVAGVFIGTSAGVAAGFGSSGLSSQQLESWYDMKRRQRLPEDDSE